MFKTLLQPSSWFRGVRRSLQYAALAGPRAWSARWRRRSGVTLAKRTPELIVSLTSIPERMATLHLCLDSLLCQSVQPDRIILWLSESRETGRPVLAPGNLPGRVTRLLSRGLEIRWCPDIGCYRKIIPARRAYPHALLVTADDDVF